MELLDVSNALLVSSKADYKRFVAKLLASRDPKKMWRGLNRVLGRDKKSEVTTVNHPVDELSVGNKLTLFLFDNYTN